MTTTVRLQGSPGLAMTRTVRPRPSLAVAGQGETHEATEADCASVACGVGNGPAVVDGSLPNSTNEFPQAAVANRARMRSRP